MDQRYDEAVQIAANAYRALGYSASPRCIFQNAARELKKHVSSNGLHYTPELAKEWVSANSRGWGYLKTVTYTRAVAVLEDVIEHGQVTTSLRHRNDRIIVLNEQYRSILDDYLSFLPYGKSCLTRIELHCRRFFWHLEKAGIENTSMITRGIVESFLEQDSHASTQIAEICRRDVVHCLENMAHLGLMPETEWCQIKKAITPMQDSSAPLSEPERRRFLELAGCDCKQAIDAFEEGRHRLAELLLEGGYSSTVRHASMRAANEFCIFMETNNFPYSNALAMGWVELSKSNWPRWKFLAYRRALFCLGTVIATRELPPTSISPSNPRKPPEWCDDDLTKYLDERHREGCAKSTLSMIRNACLRFVAYLDVHNIRAWGKVTPFDVKDFHAQDKHATAQGRGAYASRVRGFIRFLSREGLVPDTLHLSVPAIAAPRVRVVRTLSDMQVEAIHAFRNNASTPDDLRASAIVMLGLGMGLRGSDIAALQMRDISWGDSALSILQKKTGRPLALPLTTDAGNSLWRYINEGRPKQATSPNVFVRHSAPYCGMSRHTFGRMLGGIVALAGDGATCGFHITRRTFASKLLAAGNDVGTISSVLGQTGTDTVGNCLSTYADGMRLCAIGLDGIAYGGSMGL